MGIFNRLIKPNAVVRIEVLTVTRDTSGGPVYTWSTVEDNVKVMASGFGGNRDRRYSSDLNTLSGTISGTSSNLGRADVRVYFKSATGNVTDLVGVYARLESTSTHGGTLTRLIPYKWYTARFQVQRAV